MQGSSRPCKSCFQSKQQYGPEPSVDRLRIDKEALMLSSVSILCVYMWQAGSCKTRLLQGVATACGADLLHGAVQQGNGFCRPVLAG